MDSLIQAGCNTQIGILPPTTKLIKKVSMTKNNRGKVPDFMQEPEVLDSFIDNLFLA